MTISKIKILHDMLKSGEISCVELTKKYIDSIKAENDKLNAYVFTTEELSLEQAKAVDEKIKNGEEIGLLEGIPMTLKDNISTNGIETTCCSKILTGYKPIYDAFVWQELKKQGAILLGKTNMDEFAMGSTCETSYYGGASNPHNLNRVPGGSSGGGASAVSGNIAVYALGSDTGGSIRQPASFCGVVGLKPTYGAVSRYGLVAFASSLDQIGPITTSVEDAAIVFDAISGQDYYDSTSSGAKETTADKLNNDIKGVKIGIPKEYYEGLTEDVKSALDKAIEKYKELGAEIVHFDLPIIKYALPVYYILACAEASSNLGRYDSIRYGYRTKSYNGIHDMMCKTRSEGFGSEVKRRILLGTYVLSSGYYDAYYKKAQNLRGTIVKAFKEAFTKCDVILTPTVPMTAFEKNRKTSSAVENYQTDICTVPVNIAGLPGVSIPCGFDKEGMPIGMQIIGNSFEESKILNVAYKFEQATDFYKKAEMGVEF